MRNQTNGCRMLAVAASLLALSCVRLVKMEGDPAELRALAASAKEKGAKLYEQASAMMADLKSQSGGPNEEQEAEIDLLMEQIDIHANEAERFERMAKMQERIQAPAPRRTPASRPGSQAPTAAVPVNPFLSAGDFLQQIHMSSIPDSGEVAERLQQYKMAASTYSQERIASEGGVLVPSEYRETIFEKVNAPTQLLPRTDNMPLSGNSIGLPVDETTDWDSDGIDCFWDGEGQTITPSKVKLESRQVRLHRLTALVVVTEELLEDATALGAYINRKVPRKMGYKVSKGIMQGTGVGQPLGLKNANSTVTVAAEGSQAADTILPQNIAKMYARLAAECLPNAVWIANQDVMPQLLLMTLQGTGGGVFPLYMPPNGLAEAPFGTLMGRPILFHEAADTLGDVGDITFTDLSQYLTITKAGGISADQSMHVYFDQNLNAFRFIFRMNGQSWWRAPITPDSGSANTLGCAVNLAAR